MLQQAINAFKAKCIREGEEFIFEEYELKNGLYILVKENEDGSFKEIDRLSINKDFSGKSNEYYNFIKEVDCRSKLISTNKTLDQKKKIFSNNCYAFIVKKERINTKEVTDSVIEGFKKALKKLDEETFNEKRFDNFIEFIKDQVLTTEFSDKEKTEYVKVLVVTDMENYKEEERKYIKAKIFNEKGKKVIEGKEFGIIDMNFTVNASKPFLQNVTRKEQVPLMINFEEAMWLKKFYEYMIIINKSHKIMYFSEDDVLTDIKNNFNGIMIKIGNKNGSAQVENIDAITNYRAEINEFAVENALELEEQFMKNFNYSKAYTRKEMSTLVSEFIFDSRLEKNYLIEHKDIKLNPALKERIIRYRDKIFAWAYRGIDRDIEKTLIDASYHKLKHLIEESKKEDRIYAVRNVYNFLISIKEYFKKGEIEEMKTLRQRMIEALLSDEQELKIESNKEYYFIAGQVIEFILDKRQDKDKKQNIINEFLNCKDRNNLLNKIKRCYKKYNHELTENDVRFKKMYAAILSENFTPGKVDEDALLHGYLSKNIIYTKVNKEETEVEIENN